MRIKFVDPVRSMIGKRASEKRKHLPHGGGFQKGNKYGVGDFLPGDPSRNPNCAANLKPQQHLKNNFNPFGSKGFKHYGHKRPRDMKKIPEKTREQKEREAVVREGREIKELAASHAARAIEVMAEILDNTESLDMVRLAAANSLLDRGHGKATQTNVNATVNADAKPSEIDDKSLADRIDSALKRIERITGGEGEPAAGQERPADIRKLN